MLVGDDSRTLTEDPVTEPTRSIEDVCPSRRSVFRGLLALGGVVLVPGVLTACSSSPGTADGSGGGGGGGSIPAGDVTVGHAVVVEVGGESVVVAQPTEGDYVAWSANCTHQGTVVDAGSDLVLTCPNHGSRFDAADNAAVINGPATSPLRPVDVALQGDQLVIG